MKIAFLLDPLSYMQHKEDTSFSLMRECERKGHEVFYFQSQDLRLHHSTLEGRLSKCFMDPKRGVQLTQARWQKLTTCHAIIIRKEPPFDMNYLSAMYLLDFVRQKTFLMNDSNGIRSTNEKLSSLLFPRWTPTTLVGSRPEHFEALLQHTPTTRWVLKSLFGKGGAGIEEVHKKDPQLKQKINRLTQGGEVPVQLQAFVPHRRDGDKRILILDGKPLGAFRRIPGKHDFRANMALGGRAAKAVITSQEKRLVKGLGNYLKKNGLWLVGIDVLKGRLTEMNVTSPAGIPEINRFDGTALEKTVVRFIERKAH